MKKILSLMAIIIMAMLAFTACSSDDDDSADNNGSGATSSIETLMTTAPTRTGWSGDTIDGVLYYRPQTSAVNAKSNKLLAKALRTRASYDEDDDDDDIHATTFYSFYINGGKLSTSYDAPAKACIKFENKDEAQYFYQMIKSGRAFEDSEDYEDPSENYADHIYVEYMKTDVRISPDGKTVWFPMNNLKKANFTASELKHYISFCLSCLNGDGIYNVSVQKDIAAIDRVAFGEADDKFLNYTGFDISNDTTLFTYQYRGLRKFDIKSYRITSSDGYTSWMLTTSYNFDTSQNALNFYNSDDFTDLQEDEKSINGTIVTRSEYGEPYDEKEIRKNIIYLDFMYNIPLHLTFVAQMTL